MTTSLHARPAGARRPRQVPDAESQGPPKTQAAGAGGVPDREPGSEPTLPPGFETEKAAREEDRTRTEGLRRARPLPGRTTWLNIGPRLHLLERLPFPSQFPPRDPADFDRVQARLTLAGLPGSADPMSSSLASAVSMRTIRQGVIGAMLAAFKDLPDEALATATVINQRWVYSPATLNGVTAAGVKARFRADLNRIGLTKLPDPFIAILHGEFEPRSGFLCAALSHPDNLGKGGAAEAAEGEAGHEGVLRLHRDGERGRARGVQTGAGPGPAVLLPAQVLLAGADYP